MPLPLSLAALDPALPHAGLGAARSRAISDRMSANYLSRHRDLGHLEDDVAPVADNLAADLDWLLAQAGQGPSLRRLGHCQRPHEVAKVVGEGMELEADRIGREGAARQPRPFDRVLALFDAMLCRAASSRSNFTPECARRMTSPRSP